MLVAAIGIEYGKDENRSQLNPELAKKLKVLHEYARTLVSV